MMKRRSNMKTCRRSERQKGRYCRSLFFVVSSFIVSARRRSHASMRRCIAALQSRVCASLLFPVYISEPFFRAVFVAALAIAAFALFRYWRSIEGASRRVRWLLLVLRGAALLLLVCALAGVSVEYERASGARVLIHRAGAAGAEATTGVLSSEEQQLEGIASALKKHSFAIVETADASDILTNSGGPFAAGLILTDGAIAADEAERKVESLRAATGGAPVFVVGGEQETAGTRVALESVTSGAAVRGVPIFVRCVVHGRGLRGRESLVTIADEAKVQASVSVVWTSDDEWQTVALSVTPKVAGWTTYTARIEAAGGEDAEGLLARPLTLYVEERRWRVLFFEGEPTWEAKFIRRALERSQLFDVDYFAQVSRAAAIGATAKATKQNDEGEAAANGTETDEGKRTADSSPEAKLHATLASIERLNSYDCIIVGATPNEMLSAAEAARLSAWTEKRGGGLIITGGNSFAGSIVAPNGKLYGLMPAVVDPRGFASQAMVLARDAPLEAEKTRDSVSLLPTTAGTAAALAAYSNALQETAARADALTGQGLRLGALRPGASVLAVAGRGSTTATSETGTPLIAAARYGAGRTLVFAPADSWRLRTSASGEQDEADTPYSALWQGLILWATAGARPPAEITLSDESPVAGRRVTAEIRVRDAAFAPARIEKLNAHLQPLTEADAGAPSTDNVQPREIAFVPDETDESIWRASFQVPASGLYALEADYIAGGKSGRLEKQFAAVAALPFEPGAANDTLSRVARETGGALLTNADAASELVERINAASIEPEKTRQTWELRMWWPLAFIIPLLLSAAWFIERIVLKAER
jgi:hypothetical protein